MKLLENPIPIDELRTMAEGRFGDLVKAVVDVRTRKLVVDAELHADQEAFLLEQGSRQEDLWGINLYPGLDRADPDFVEFDSMINLRPSQANLSRGVEDADIQERIRAIVGEWVA